METPSFKWVAWSCFRLGVVKLDLGKCQYAIPELLLSQIDGSLHPFLVPILSNFLYLLVSIHSPLFLMKFRFWREWDLLSRFVPINPFQ